MHFPKLETTLDQALDIALDLEELELDNIYRRLLALTSDDSRMSSAFRTALGQYSHHEERLLAAIEKHSKIPHSSSALQRPAAACSAAGEDPATTRCDPRRGGGLRGDPTARGVIRSQPQSLCLTESASSEWRSQYRRTPCVLTRKDVLKSVGDSATHAGQPASASGVAQHASGLLSGSSSTAPTHSQTTPRRFDDPPGARIGRRAAPAQATCEVLPGRTFRWRKE